MLHISGTIQHMIVVYGTHVQNDNISWPFFHFFKILILWFVKRVKGQKTVKNNKKFYLPHTPYLRNHTSYNFHLWYTCVK